MTTAADNRAENSSGGWHSTVPTDQLPTPDSLIDGLMTAIDKATEADLAIIDEKIAAVHNKLEGLRKLRSVVAIALGRESRKSGYQKKEKTPAAPSAGGAISTGNLAASNGGPGIGAEKVDSKRKDIGRYLLKVGHAHARDIMLKCSVAAPHFTVIMSHSWFLKDDKGYSLTNAGSREVKELDDE